MAHNATLFNGVTAEDNSVLETMSHCLVICYQCFGAACCLHLQGKKKRSCWKNWLHYSVEGGAG